MKRSYRDYRPRLTIDCTEEQLARIQDFFPDRKLFIAALLKFTDCLLDETEAHGEFPAAIVAYSSGDLLDVCLQLSKLKEDT